MCTHSSHRSARRKNGARSSAAAARRDAVTGARITRARTSSTPRARDDATPTHHGVVLAGATPIHPRTVITLVIDQIKSVRTIRRGQNRNSPMIPPSSASDRLTSILGNAEWVVRRNERANDPFAGRERASVRRSE